MLIIKRADLSREKVHILDLAKDVGAVNEITDIEWAKQQQHYACREIGQRSLQGQSNRKTGGADNCDNGRCLDAKSLKHHQDGEGSYDVARYRSKKLEQRVVKLLILFSYTNN